MVILILAIIVYFLPALIAKHRKHQSSGAIFALNLLLGWSLIGWVIAIVWALTAVTNK